MFRHFRHSLLTLSSASATYLFVNNGNSINATSSCSNAPPSNGIKNHGLEGCVGNTPMVYIKSLSEDTKCHIYAKLELRNPSGSIKDRTALGILNEAEASNKLKKGGTIVEGTGGNTGIALAQLGAAKGYKVILCMPNSIAQEKIAYSKRFGAEIHLQPLVPLISDFRISDFWISGFPDFR